MKSQKKKEKRKKAIMRSNQGKEIIQIEKEMMQKEFHTIFRKNNI